MGIGHCEVTQGLPVPITSRMVLKAAEYYLTNLAQEWSGKSWKNDMQIM